MIPNLEPSEYQYTPDQKQQKSSESLSDKRVRAFLRKSEKRASLKRRVFRQLLFCLGHYENASTRVQIALLRQIKRDDAVGLIERERILDHLPLGRRRKQAETLLIEACQELIYDLSGRNLEGGTQ